MEANLSVLLSMLMRAIFKITIWCFYIFSFCYVERYVCMCVRQRERWREGEGEKHVSLFLYQRFKKAKDLGHEPDLMNLSRY